MAALQQLIIQLILKNLFPKERIEIFSENSIYQIDNFKRLNIYSNRKKVHRSTYQDKGINQCIKTFCDLISSNPINFDYESFINEIFLSSKISIELQDSLNEKF